MRRICGLLLLVGLGLTPATGLAADGDLAALKKLVAKLSSRRYAEREAATTALIAQRAPAAIQLLRKAVLSPDREVRRRARLVLDRLECCRETEQVLKPGRIRLNYKSILVAEAVADFARRTGLPLVLNPADRVRVARRTVTLQTGDTTVWDALRQLCDKAGLAERAPALTPPQTGYNPYGNFAPGRPQQVIFLDGRQGYQTKRDEHLVLIDGKASRPTCLAGALRIQVLTAPARKGGSRNVSREVTLTLNIDNEPRLLWNRVVALRVDRAVDSLGQKLRQPLVYANDDGAGLFQANEVIVIWDGTSQLPTNKSRQVPVRLRLGERAARQIKELRGVVSVEVETPPEALVVVADVLKAAGQTVKGPNGTYVKVLDAKRAPGGQITLKVAVKMPPKKSDFAGMGNVRILRINRGRGFMMNPGHNLSLSTVASRGLALVDGKGQPVAYTTGGHQAPDDPREAQVYSLNYRPRKDQVGPFRFTFSGRRTVVLEVPFALKDVPLP